MTELTRDEWHQLADLAQRAGAELRAKDRVAWGVMDTAREVAVRMLGGHPYRKPSFGPQGSEMACAYCGQPIPNGAPYEYVTIQRFGLVDGQLVQTGVESTALHADNAPEHRGMPCCQHYFL